jgi:hypothetical protein
LFLANNAERSRHQEKGLRRAIVTKLPLAPLTPEFAFEGKAFEFSLQMIFLAAYAASGSPSIVLRQLGAPHRQAYRRRTASVMRPSTSS